MCWSIRTVVEILQPGDQARIETYSPQTKDVFTAQYKYSKYSALLRLSYFGEVSYWPIPPKAHNSPQSFDGNKVETLDQTFGGKLLTDISLSYSPVKIATITIAPITCLMYTPISKRIIQYLFRPLTYSRAYRSLVSTGVLFARLSVNL